MDEIKDFLKVLGLAERLVTSSTGAPKERVAQDIEKITRWVTKSGKKWTIVRLKDLKAIALKLIGGEVPDLSSYLGRKTEYKGYEIPALWMFSILIDSINQKNYKGIRSILDLINSYYVFNGPGDDIEEKINTITQKSPEIENLDKVSHEILALITKHFPFPKSRPYAMGFKGPDIGGSRYAMKPRKNSDCITAIMPSLSTIPQWIFDEIPGIKEWILNQPFFQKITKYEKTLFADGRNTPSAFWAGNLAILGESGFKTRIVFVGNPWIQGILKPCMVPLQRRLLSLDSDCTFDQEKGIDFLREATRAGKTIHSIDLTSATDNFPFFLQRHVGLLCGIPEMHLDVMRFSGFNHPFSQNEKEISIYGRGQGMGLYPSFALFALTHNIILHALATELSLKPSSNYFRVLGDDVIITHDGLAKSYYDFLKKFKIPMSSKKTFNSTQLGEFAGKVLWKGKDVTPIKWRRVTVASLQVVSQYLDRGLIRINEKEQRIDFIPLCDRPVYSHIEALLPLSKELGGFDGLTRHSLSERLAWGSRYSRSLRAGYLKKISERIYTFLTGERLLRNLDATKLLGMENQGLKLTEFKRRWDEEPNREPLMWESSVMCDPFFNDMGPEKDIPETREGLKGIESIVFSTDSLEEQLGKYHAWRIAMLGPNPAKEFNRLVTCSPIPVDLSAVPVVSSSTELKRLTKVRPCAPRTIQENYELAEERVKMLRDLKTKIRDKPETLTCETGDPWLKLAGTLGAGVINPVLGLATGIASLISHESEKEDLHKPQRLDDLVPL